VSSKELKDLIIVNLTGIIAVATSIKTMFPQSTTNPDINNLLQNISLFYWVFIAGLLVSYINIHKDEKKQNRNLPIVHKIETRISKKIENIYSYILISNLLFTAVFILISVIVFSNYLSILPKNLIRPLLWSFQLLPYIAGLEAFFAIAYPTLAPLYFYIKERIGVNPIMLLGAVAFFGIAFKLWTHL
jgi:hypothetical protein